MYNPSFRTKSNNVPILSKQEIEGISERFISEFCPEALEKPQPVDVEKFVEGYLGMTLDFQYLSSDGRYLGMTVFNDTDKVIIFDAENKQADYLHANARTVIIDNRLLAENQRHRYRYTMGHEAGHDIFHSAFYYFDPAQISLFDGMPEFEKTPMVQCRLNSFEKLSQTGNTKQWSDDDWMEWQANYFSSAFLMPRPAMMKLAEYCKKKHMTESGIISKVSEVFDVSAQSATYRCRELNIIKSNIDHRAIGLFDCID